jgi:hypothetical protein
VEAVEQERRDVTGVDDLGQVGRVAGHEHPPAARDPPRPVGEPVGRVMRPADEPGPADQRPGAVDLPDDRLAQRLVRAVVLREVRAVRLERGHRRVLKLRLGGGLAGVDGHGGDEDVPAGAVLESVGGQPGRLGRVAGDVDHRVELAAVKRRQVRGPVADDRLHAGKQPAVGDAPVEHGDGVTAPERGFDDGAARETGAAQN